MARKRSQPAAARQLICDRCGILNPTGAPECSACGSERFAPQWVLHQRRINRQFAVQVTEPNRAFDNSGTARLTLSKWWPGGRATFHIPSADQWEQIKGIVDRDLAQYLHWQTQQAVQQTIAQGQKDARKATAGLQATAKANPTLITEILRGIKFDKITEDDVPQIGRAIGDIAGVLIDADDSMRRAIQRIVKQLPAQGSEAVSALSDLMESVTLAQINAVTNEVRRRVNLLKVFKERVNDERTYEITGDGSIHRLLESAMWIVNERYWLMHSNATLRTVVGKELAKRHDDFKKKRPDFVCGSVDRRLIVIEIKRPSRVLQVEDLDQLEEYIVTAREYLDEPRAPFEAILVGKRATDDLRKRLDVRGSRAFQVKTYASLIDDTEHRYESYLKALEETDEDAA